MTTVAELLKDLSTIVDDKKAKSTDQMRAMVAIEEIVLILIDRGEKVEDYLEKKNG